MTTASLTTDNFALFAVAFVTLKQLASNQPQAFPEVFPDAASFMVTLIVFFAAPGNVVLFVNKHRSIKLINNLPTLKAYERDYERYIVPGPGRCRDPGKLKYA